MRKQGCRADFLDSSVRDLQRKLDSNRVEIHCTNQGYEESRKEQARLHEELAQRERVLRETQIRSIHEVGELKIDQEMRIHEFLLERIERKSRYNRGAHLTSTGVAEKNELDEWFSRISRYRVDLQWKFISRSQSAGSRSKSLWYAKPRPKPATWNIELAWYMEKRFWQPLTPVYSSSTPYQGMNQSATGGNPVRDGAVKPVAWSEERNRETIPLPRFARRP